MENTVRSPFAFQGGMDEVTLRRYAARAVTYQTLVDAKVDLDEAVRLITNVGAKYVGRAGHFSWGGNLSLAQVEDYYARCAQVAERVHAVDPEVILQGGVFEIIYKGTVDSQPIPAYVFEAFGLPVEERNFCWEDMLFPADFEFGDKTWKPWGSPNQWNKNAAWPFIGRLEAQMYFFYSVTRFIQAGFEAIHLGQAEKMTGCRYEYLTGWDRVTTLCREYAKQHARRGVVLFDAHTVIGGPSMKIGDRLILDIVGAGMVPIDDKKEDGVLKCKVCDYTESWCTWVGRSEGGKHPLGFVCETQPTIIEFDNYGRPGPVGEWNDNYSPWGYDDITWFATQPQWYRSEFLTYADKVFSTTRTDKLGQVYFLQPPLRRNLCCNGDEPRIHYVPGPDFDPAYFEAVLSQDGATAEQQPDGSFVITAGHQYRANTTSAACPMGFGQEETIKRIFAAKV